MGKTKKQIHFEQVPIEVVKKIVPADVHDSHTSSTACAICGERVDVGNSKTDERGRAVHEACYVARLRHSRSLHFRS